MIRSDRSVTPPTYIPEMCVEHQTAFKSARTVALYEKRYGRQDRIFRQIDRLLRRVVGGPSQRASTSQPPKRILLVNAGYLGDVILSTGLLPVLHDAFPGVQIGFLTGTYARPIIEEHPLIAQTHFIDHWYLSRATMPQWRRAIDYAFAVPAMIHDLRTAQYNVAIDVRNWYPNFVPLIWMARIPIRVGYTRLGCSSFLTHSVGFDYCFRHEFDYHLSLVRALGAPERSLSLAWPVLKPPSAQDEDQAARILNKTARFRVLHPIASVATRDWPIERWQSLARKLAADGIIPVVTGSGRRDADAADAICAAEPQCINAVNRLSWGALIALLSRAEAVYAVETSIGHAASALRRPVISIYGGMADPDHWSPLGSVVATKRFDCHPCLNREGCQTRPCLTDLTVPDVQNAARLATRSAERLRRDGLP